jgi:hypothetical protein
VWPFEGDLGYRRALESAGSVTTPLLAGFSFTLLALLLPTLSSEKTVVITRGGTRVVNETQSFSAAPELAAGFFLFAGLLFVFSVQVAVFLRYRNHCPSDLQEWFPEYFPVGNGGKAPRFAAKLEEWSTADWPAIRVGDQWFGGWPRRYLAEEIARANRYAQGMRHLYHGGILALLIGLTTMVWPPAETADAGRWILVIVGGAGAIVEIVWILKLALAGRRER